MDDGGLEDAIRRADEQRRRQRDAGQQRDQLRASWMAVNRETHRQLEQVATAFRTRAVAAGLAALELEIVVEAIKTQQHGGRLGQWRRTPELERLWPVSWRDERIEPPASRTHAIYIRATDAKVFSLGAISRPAGTQHVRGSGLAEVGPENGPPEPYKTFVDEAVRAMAARLTEKRD